MTFVIPSWHQHAECRGLDPDLFFPADEGEFNEAVAVCRRCPVRLACLRDALDRNETVGVWGGMSPRGRDRIRRREREERRAREQAPA